jgi:hypothetical protein
VGRELDGQTHRQAFFCLSRFSFCSPKMLRTSAPLSPHMTLLSPTRRWVLSPALEPVPKRHKLSVGDKKLSSAPAPEHTGLPFSEQVFTHCNLSYSSQSSRIARDACSPRPGLRSYFRSSVCSGHPMGMVNDNRHDSPHRRAAQFECDSSRRFVTRGS